MDAFTVLKVEFENTFSRVFPSHLTGPVVLGSTFKYASYTQ